MLSPVEIGAIIAATKGAVDIFDKLAGPIKRLLLPGERYEQAEAKDQRWRFKVETEGKDIVVKERGETRQVITGDQLAQKLNPDDLALVQTYERKMQDYFQLWSSVYSAKDMSQDPLVNAKTDAQLRKLISSMRSELLGILAFLQQVGVHLDDHYLHVRSLVESQPPQ
jgi:DNA polymerase I-like protein with 3'-5' exonuclease and polymerase domains